VRRGIHGARPDVTAFLRIAVVWNVPVACNRTSADFMISSPLMGESYQGLVPEYATLAESSESALAGE
jgi:methylglyoxal synthase